MIEAEEAFLRNRLTFFLAIPLYFRKIGFDPLQKFQGDIDRVGFVGERYAMIDREVLELRNVQNLVSVIPVHIDDAVRPDLAADNWGNGLMSSSNLRPRLSKPNTGKPPPHDRVYPS